MAALLRIFCACLIDAGPPGTDASLPVPETNPFSSEADIQQGGALFQTHCSYCHGSSGEGGRGADLTAGIYRRGGRDLELCTRRSGSAFPAAKWDPCA